MTLHLTIGYYRQHILLKISLSCFSSELIDFSVKLKSGNESSLVCFSMLYYPIWFTLWEPREPVLNKTKHYYSNAYYYSVLYSTALHTEAGSVHQAKPRQWSVIHHSIGHVSSAVESNSSELTSDIAHGAAWVWKLILFRSFQRQFGADCFKKEARQFTHSTLQHSGVFATVPLRFCS